MRAKRTVSIAFYIIFVFTMLFIISVSAGNPLNNLLPIQMAVFEVIFIVLVLGINLLWSFLYKKIQKAEPIIYTCLLIVLGILLFVLSYRQIPSAYANMGDYHKVFHTADIYAFGGIIEFSSYFRNYSNNIAPMLLLALLFKISAFLHIKKEMFLMGLVCLQVVCTVRSMGYLLEKEDDRTWRVPIAVMFFLWLPLWGTSYAFYTDTMSMGLCVIAIAIIKKIKKMYDVNSEKISLYVVLLSVLTAILITFAAKWKITGTIPVIAYLIVSFLKTEKIRYKRWISLLVSLVLVYSIVGIYLNSFEITRSAKNTEDPLISWMALGMRGDGTWRENALFAEYEHTLPDKAAKRAYVIEYISDNWKEALSFKHIYYKTRANFADGNMRARDYTTFFYDGSIYWDLFNPNGKYLWRVSQYDYLYLMTVYVFLLLGAIVNLFRLFLRKDYEEESFIAHLTFFGAVVFLMMWEANTRQLYNIMPMLFVGAFYFIKAFVEGCKREAEK